MTDLLNSRTGLGQDEKNFRDLPWIGVETDTQQ